MILHYLPEQIEEELGDGSRWGIDLHYHLTRKGTNPYPTIRTIAKTLKDPWVVLGKGDYLPEIKEDLFDNPKEPIFFQNEKGNWNGWGILPRELLTLNAFPQDLVFETHPVKTGLSALDFNDIQQANTKVLNNEKADQFLPTTARMVEPGIWISRSVSLHPSVRFNPPVFIGENTQIHEEVELGPNTVIGRGSIIDGMSKITNSVVYPKSYIGECLELNKSIVDRNLLINLVNDSKIHIEDDFILSEVKVPSVTYHLLHLVGRVCAGIILLLLSPLLLVFIIKNQMNQTTFLKIPAPLEPTLWKTFPIYQIKSAPRLTHLLKLWNILRGDIHFVGLPPRTPKEVNQLPNDWKKMYLSGKIGCITLADTMGDLSPDQVYTTEAFYVVQMSLWMDLKILFNWIWRTACRK